MSRIFFTSVLFIALLFINCNDVFAAIDAGNFQVPSSSSNAQRSVIQKARVNPPSKQKKKGNGKKKSKTGNEVIHNSEDQKQTDSIKVAQNKLKGIK